MFLGIISRNTTNPKCELSLITNSTPFKLYLSKSTAFKTFLYNDNKFDILIYGNIYNCGLDNFTDEKVAGNFIVNKIINNDTDFYKNLNGEFIIIIHNKIIETITIYRDQFGFIPCYYFKDNDVLMFSSHIKLLTQSKIFHIKLNDDWLNYSLFKIGSNNTAFENLYNIEASHFLLFSKNEIKTEKYWSINTKENNDIAEEEAIVGFRDKLINSIAKRINNDVNVSCELSGGIDSSTITSISAKIKSANVNSKVFAFSFVLDKNLKNELGFKDELEFGCTVADNYPNINHIKLTIGQDSLINNLTKVIKELGYSPFNPSARMIMDEVNISLKNNSRIIFSGHGGDHFVSSQGVDHAKLMLNKFNISGFFPFVNEYKKLRQVSFFKAIIILIGTTFLPKLYSKYKRTFFRGINSELINKKFLNKKLLSNYANSGNVNKPDEYNSKLVKNLKTNNLHYRIESCSEYAMLHNVRFLFPLLDIDLLEYYFSIPSEIKVKTTETRPLIREAIKGIVPEKIRKRRDKTVNKKPFPSNAYLSDHERITDFIFHCKKNLKNHYVDYDFMLKWHNNLKNRTSFKSKYNLHFFITVLSYLIFQDLFEKGEL